MLKMMEEGRREKEDMRRETKDREEGDEEREREREREREGESTREEGGVHRNKGAGKLGLLS